MTPEEYDNIIKSNARAIESLAENATELRRGQEELRRGQEELRRSQEQINRRFDSFLSEMTRDRALVYERLQLLENNQTRLIDILRLLNQRITQLEEGNSA